MGVPLVAGAAAAGGGIPWSIVLPIMISLLGDLFGKSDEEDLMGRTSQAQQMMNQLGMRKPYQSPYAGIADRSLIKALLGRVSKMGNWGWPEGMGIDLSSITDMLGQSPYGGAGRRIKL